MERTAAVDEVRLTVESDEGSRRWIMQMREMGATHASVYAADFQGGEYRVLLTREDLRPPENRAAVRGVEVPPDHRWHVSVSRMAGYDVPPWEALAAIVHAVRPGVTFVIGVPPRSFWLNVHPGVLHAMETKDENLEERWKAETRALRETPPT